MGTLFGWGMVGVFFFWGGGSLELACDDTSGPERTTLETGLPDNYRDPL